MFPWRFSIENTQGHMKMTLPPMARFPPVPTDLVPTVPRQRCRRRTPVLLRGPGIFGRIRQRGGPVPFRLRVAGVARDYPRSRPAERQRAAHAAAGRLGGVGGRASGLTQGVPTFSTTIHTLQSTKDGPSSSSTGLGTQGAPDSHGTPWHPFEDLLNPLQTRKMP